MGYCGILAVIVVGVWILANVLRPRGEQPARPQRRTSARSSDLDRFLDEIEQRRRRAEERRPQPPPDVPISVVPVRPRPPTRQPRPAPPSKVTPAPAAPRVLDLVVQEVVPVSAPQAPAATPPSAPPAAAPAPSAPAVPRRFARPTPAQEQLLELLRTPQSLRTAFLLREVLGPPLCRRRRTRG